MWTHNPRVGGSSPSTATFKPRRKLGRIHFMGWRDEKFIPSIVEGSPSAATEGNPCFFSTGSGGSCQVGRYPTISAVRHTQGTVAS